MFRDLSGVLVLSDRVVQFLRFKLLGTQSHLTLSTVTDDYVKSPQLSGLFSDSGPATFYRKTYVLVTLSESPGNVTPRRPTFNRTSSLGKTERDK